ncbi:recombinase XerD [Actinomadura craniellae]|uniref:Recombinase XerD n=1 Tax=Actinomadura craniellae TaxID=2231787 RepID=A0A365H404_9ACTN|nr:tyrosine-type recombinase/integrase [Actinomadura craniellae]RAY13845.1 recombinase XerD [Actinomadura craniellae]
MPATRPRERKNLNAGVLQSEIDSFRLHLNSERKAEKTVRTYIEAAQWFAAHHLLRKPGQKAGLGAGKDEWQDVNAEDIRRWMAWLLGRYSDSYANNQYRALQAFFKWWAKEEELPNPMDKLKPPTIDEKAVPFFTDEELKKLLRVSEGRTFMQRRDHAIISLFRATGIRLSELAGIRYVPGDPERSDIDLYHREILVRGKGGKERVVKFDHQTARSIDRYLRMRKQQAYAHSEKLWLGINNRCPMTANGVYQMIKRRGNECGVPVNPHKFRHHFSHTWLDKGGPEGDLMELNGWTSPQMLRRYGASARSARARRSYDRIMEQE